MQNVAQKLLAAEAAAGNAAASSTVRSGGAAAEAAYINDADVSSGYALPACQVQDAFGLPGHMHVFGHTPALTHTPP